MTMKLNDANLAALPDAIKRPTHDRSALKSGIVQFGVGNFRRAPQAWSLHRFKRPRLVRDWAINGAGVRPYGEAMRAKFAYQDYWTTLIALNPECSKANVVGSMLDCVRQRWLLQNCHYNDLANAPVFPKAFGKWRKMIYRNGIVAAIQRYVKGD
jgi:mannitol-1-phosphate/altronate dehydrogenase